MMNYKEKSMYYPNEEQKPCVAPFKRKHLNHSDFFLNPILLYGKKKETFQLRSRRPLSSTVEPILQPPRLIET